MRVTVQRSLGVSVGALVAGQVPDDESLVARTGEEHVGVFEGGSEGSDPSAVALKGALQDKLFRHGDGVLGVAVEYSIVGSGRGPISQISGGRYGAS